MFIGYRLVLTFWTSKYITENAETRAQYTVYKEFFSWLFLIWKLIWPLTASVPRLWHEGQKSHRSCSFLQQRKSKSSHPTQKEWGKILLDD